MNYSKATHVFEMPKECMDARQLRNRSTFKYITKPAFYSGEVMEELYTVGYECKNRLGVSDFVSSAVLSLRSANNLVVEDAEPTDSRLRWVAAAVDFEQGDIVQEYLGMFMFPSDCEDESPSAVVIKVEGQAFLINADTYCNELRFCNSDENPNTTFHLTVVDDMVRFLTVAARPIAKGEEITIERGRGWKPPYIFHAERDDSSSSSSQLASPSDNESIEECDFFSKTPSSPSSMASVAAEQSAFDPDDGDGIFSDDLVSVDSTISLDSLKRLGYVDNEEQVEGTGGRFCENVENIYNKSGRFSLMWKILRKYIRVARSRPTLALKK